MSSVTVDTDHLPGDPGSPLELTILMPCLNEAETVADVRAQGSQLAR